MAITKITEKELNITQNVDFHGFKGINIGSPTASGDISTKAYTDSVAGGGTILVRNYFPTDLINGSNLVFTVPTYVPNSLCVYLNGFRMCPGATRDYEETSSTSFTFKVGQTPQTNDVIMVDYET